MKKKGWIALFLFPAILLEVVFIFFPIVMNFYYSLFEWSAFSTSMKFIGLRNYTALFTDETIGTAVRNNIIFAVLSILFQVGVAMVLAAILEEKAVRRTEGFFRVVYFIPSLMSITVTGLLFQMLFSPRMGVVNALVELLGFSAENIDLLGNTATAIWSVAMVSQWQYTGYGVMLFLVAMQKVPREYYEAAIVDGANPMQRFLHVTVPQVRETTLVNTVITLIGAFKVFDEVYVMTNGGPGRASEVLATYLYRSGFRNDVMGYASAIACLVFVITFLLSLGQLKLSKVEVDG